MRVDPRSGLLEGVRFIPSPNADERPGEGEIDLLVVHGISLPPGEYGGEGITELFTNRLDPGAHPYYREIAGLRVSAHLLIRRDGEAIQYVPFSRRAWHAGRSCYEGRPDCNDYSIGIELEGMDDIPYAPAQYRRLAEIARALMACYPALCPERIVGHADIAPGRKTDPGPAFDWRLFRDLLTAS
ncbi:MAG: 1,6-anhydro-N-acetylmuramyl-L-alanine amidase AmpD [Gammaproteobacteria bacterium]|nr:MAG: 1,6-anhydro-N-acetylmuramyl-L-alanine amidase AmpD [Gammaproteobacteria bacterium]